MQKVCTGGTGGREAETCLRAENGSLRNPGWVFAVILNAARMNTSSRRRVGRVDLGIGTGFHGSTGRDEAL
jgi:hypothetical protein